MDWCRRQQDWRWQQVLSDHLKCTLALIIPNGWLFLKSPKIGSQISVNLAMNLLMYWSLPKKPLISLLVIGAGMSRMTLILSRSTSIPLSLTMYPSSFPEVTPKVHFLNKIIIIIINKCENWNLIIINKYENWILEIRN